MGKVKIPVYNICSLVHDQVKQEEIQVERLSEYLQRHYNHLHFPHRHSFYHMVLFTKGKGTHTIDFTKFKVKEGQLYCMIPGQVHGWQFAGEPDGYILNFSEQFFRPFLLNPVYLERFSFFSGISEEGVIHLPGPLFGKLINMFEALSKVVGAESKDMDLPRVLLLQILMEVDRKLQKTDKTQWLQQNQVVLKHFRQLIEQHYKTLRLPKEYAAMLYITPNHLNALCQDLVGITAGELIRNRVLLEAKRLLTNADMHVATISDALNFKDYSYFNRFFKKYEGQTPESFRKQFDRE